MFDEVFRGFSVVKLSMKFPGGCFPGGGELFGLDSGHCSTDGLCAGANEWLWLPMAVTAFALGLI